MGETGGLLLPVERQRPTGKAGGSAGVGKSSFSWPSEDRVGQPSSEVPILGQIG